MELRVLGALEVSHDGTPSTIHGTKPRQLLTLLAIRPNEPVPARVLIEELWEGKPPATAESALRVHVAKIRKALAPEAANGSTTRLALWPSGYLLRIAPGELDTGRFEELVMSAREANARGDPAGAEQHLTQALGLWRGPALVDASGLSAVVGELARLEELRITAIEQLAEARLALGHHADLIDVLRDAVQEFPLHESLAAHLMLALYRSGRQAEALRAFADVSHELDVQMGIGPSATLRQLEEDMLLQRHHLEGPTRRPGQSPTSARRQWRPTLIGRREELGWLLEARGEVANGERRLVLLSGPAGIGKTALTEEFCERATSLGALVLVGRCAADRGGYEAIAEILAALAHELDPSTGAAALLHPQQSGPGARFETGRELESEQLRRFESIAAAIGEVADRPVVIVVEDVHWAGRTTLLVLRHLLRLSKLERLLVVATMRDEEVDHNRAELLDDLMQPARTCRIQLAGLNDHEVRSLIRATANAQDPLIDLAPTIRDATAGNPFFIRALLRDLDEQSIDVRDRRALEASIATAAPSGVRLLIDRRVERLSSSARGVVEAAAILDRDVDLEGVAGVCDLPPATTLEAIEELLTARLLLEDAGRVDRFEFPHALVRNAVYAGIAGTRRTLLHRRAGEMLEARRHNCSPLGCDEIAYHYRESAPPGPDVKAAVWAQRAGEEAAERIAFAEAAEWFEEALRRRSPPDEPATGSLHLALGRAYDGAREFSRARDAYLAAASRARATGDATLLADIALAATAPWTSASESLAVEEELLAHALDALGPTDPQRRIHLLARLATLLYFVDPDRERSLAREACALAEQLADDTSISIALLARHLWLTHEPPARTERLEIARRAFSGTREHTTDRTQLRINRELLTDLLENGEIGSFDRELDCYADRAERVASARDIYWSMALRALQATLHGDLAMAELLAGGARLRGEALYQEAGGAEFLHQFVVRYQQGRLSEVVGVLRGATDGQPAYRAGSSLAAIACAETGHTEEGTRIARWALGENGDEIQRDYLWLGAHALFAGVAARANDVELAHLLDEQLASCPDHIVVFGSGGAVLGCTHHWRGLLAATMTDFDRAIDHLAEALRVSELMGAPFWAAQAQIDLADVAARRGRPADRAALRQWTEQAVGLAREHGFGRILDRASQISM